ncbi:sporulation protein YunB [Serpentinicella alkaliphila]|uniref:Sporulation protein YunB n=1 Tax=Serpentinicella alkaliphila TaxID=1734049 RepID=A0A4V2T324_9FIRM|nr:sporulation protein YunB [Serpentinicella alkaliphila]TCP99713.1 sporulation protein YunB [Serpentinicella alkaliphila]
MYNNYKRRKYLKYKIVSIVMLLTITFFGLFIYIDKNIAPTVQALGELKAQEIITIIVSNEVTKVLESGYKYDDMIIIKEDKEGNITLMQANTILLNRIQSDIAVGIQESLNQLKSSDNYIPLGGALGSQLLAQYGPKLKLGIMPVGVVDVNFASEFDQSGINQTRHRILLTVKTEVQVIVPFSSGKVSVPSYVPLVESVIVGKIPQSYFNIPQDNLLLTPLYSN